MAMGRTTPRFGALVAGSFALAFLGTAARARVLSLDDRVAAQKAFEQVYWEHRTWPAENAAPKPSLASVMPDAAIRAKVENDLRMSEALEELRGEPMTGAELQAEIVRIARDTRAPEILRELFAAVDGDPDLIAECLARPVLTGRLLVELAGNDPGRAIPPTSSRPARTIAPPAEGYALPAIPAGVGCINDTWATSSLTNASGANVPTARQLHTVIWTGSEMIVWGGWNGTSTAYNTGGRYTPATDSWTFSSLTGATGPDVPPARYRHTAVWTGTEMIVWGGQNAAGTALNNGGRYNVATDGWIHSALTAATGSNVPSARTLHTAVWTGTEMIVWGGTPNTVSNALNNGGRYNPSTDAWVLSLLTGATGSYTPSARVDHTAVWTGSEMIVWGGQNAGGAAVNDGGRYIPSTDAWALTNLTNALGSFTPSARFRHTAVWSGTEMIVWGGAASDAGMGLNNGGRYDPTIDGWVLSSLTNATGSFIPGGRQRHAAVWTGADMIVWGGSTDGSTALLNTGGRFAPDLDRWVLTTLTDGTGSNVPSARQYHTAIFTGASDHRFVVWGGTPNTATGGLYCAACLAVVWFGDADGDGYGDPLVTQVSCTQPAGYVALGTDCNDANPAIHPGAAEICNGLDDDCNAVVDDGGNALCADGDDCTVDLCNGAGGCAATSLTANLDATGFSAARVDGRDLVILADAWNSCPGDLAYNAAANFDQGAAPPDSCVDLTDFHLFMSSFGQSCP